MTKKEQNQSSTFQEKGAGTDFLSAQARCRSLLLVRLWREERVCEMREVSRGRDFLHPVVLELHAKASYIVLKEKGRSATAIELRHFIDCWLSFLVHPTLFRSLHKKREQPSDQNRYRLDLLAVGENMVRKYAEQQREGGEHFIRYWEEDAALLKLLSTTEKSNPPLYTPALARQAGIAEQIFSLIQENREAFTDQEHFLAAGALYSPVGPALLLARTEQYDAAKEVLASFEAHNKEKSKDPFIQYGLARVRILSGLHALDRSCYDEAGKLLTDALPLPCPSSGLERELLAAFDQEDRYLDPNWLGVSVHVISEAHKYSPSKEVKTVFCSVLTHQAVLLHNEGSIDRELLLASMKKAVSLNPADEFARMTFDDARMDAEIYALHQTMSQGELSKASRIAKNSSFQKVVDQFFIFVAQVIEQVEVGEYPDDTSTFFMVSQLLESALEVAPEHEMIRDIAVLLDELEERMENP